MRLTHHHNCHNKFREVEISIEILDLLILDTYSLGTVCLQQNKMHTVKALLEPEIKEPREFTRTSGSEHENIRHFSSNMYCKYNF